MFILSIRGMISPRICYCLQYHLLPLSISCETYTLSMSSDIEEIKFLSTSFMMMAKFIWNIYMTTHMDIIGIIDICHEGSNEFICDIVL